MPPRTITHRELRNDSAKVLRAVKAGERYVVTNGGEPCAVLSPPGDLAPVISRRRTQRYRAADVVRVPAEQPTGEVLAALRDDDR